MSSFQKLPFYSVNYNSDGSHVSRLETFFSAYNLDVSYNSRSDQYRIFKNDGLTMTQCLVLKIDDSSKKIDLLQLNKCGPVYGSGFNLLLLLKMYAYASDIEQIALYDASRKRVLLNGHAYEYSLATLFLLSTGRSYYNHFGFYEDASHHPNKKRRIYFHTGLIRQNVAWFFDNIIKKKLKNLSFKILKDYLGPDWEFGNDDEENMCHPDSRPNDLNPFKSWYTGQFQLHLSPVNEQLMTVEQFFSRVFDILYRKQHCEYYDDHALRFFILSINLIWACILENGHVCDLIWKKREGGGDDSDIRERTITILEIACQSETCKDDIRFRLKSEFNADGTCVRCTEPRSSYQVFIFPNEQQPVMPDTIIIYDYDIAADADDIHTTKRPRGSAPEDLGGTRRRVRRVCRFRHGRRKSSTMKKKKNTPRTRRGPTR